MVYLLIAWRFSVVTLVYQRVAAKVAAARYGEMHPLRDLAWTA
jgi:hypothetical protein